MASFDVPYEPGILRAAGFTGGAQAAECAIRTTGAPSAIRLAADRGAIRAGEGDLGYVTAEVVDGQGNRVLDADHEIHFTVQGAGSILAVGSANPTSAERYVGDRRRAFQGRCLAVVKPGDEPGEICLAARAEGLDAGEARIRVE